MPHGFSENLTCFARPPLHMFPQSAVDVRLIAFALGRVELEPGDHVGVQPQREGRFTGR